MCACSRISPGSCRRPAELEGLTRRALSGAPGLCHRLRVIPRRHLAASDLAREPQLLWEAFVDLLKRERLDRMSELQRTARLAFEYDAEVSKGGHRRYFESDAVYSARDTIRALDTLRLGPQARLLERALALWESSGRQVSPLLEMLARAVLSEELSEVDAAYAQLAPTVTEALEGLLAEHRDEFVIVDDK